MRYKGIKVMKRAAALAVSAALMLTDIEGVSAAERETTAESQEEIVPESRESDDTKEPEAAEQSGGEESSAQMETAQIPESTLTGAENEMQPSPSEENETKFVVDENDETQPSPSEEDETQSSPSENDETQSLPSEEVKAEEIDNAASGEESSDASESASESATGEQAKSPEIKFAYHGSNDNAAITGPIKISIKSPVVIKAAPNVALPMDSKVQWASSKSAYVKASAKADILGAGVAEIEGLKPTDGSVQITCVISYKENGQTKYIKGILDVSVNPLAKSVSIKLGKNDVTNKKVIYDIGAKKFIAIDENKLPEPVDSFSAAVYPEGASQKVIWKSNNTSVMKFADENSGNVEGSGTGEAVVTVSTTDGSKGSDKNPISGKVTVKARRIITDLSFTPKMDDKNGTVLEEDENGRIEITSGASIFLEPKYTPVDATEKKVAWTNGNKNAVEIKSDKNNVLKVTAKDVPGETVVILTAKTNDMSDISREVKLVVKPKVTEIKIYKADSGNTVGDNLGGKRIGVDLDDPASPKEYILRAVNVPDNASRKVTWEISNDKAAELQKIDGNTCKVTAKEKGEAVITATAADGSKTKVSITFKVTSLAKGAVIKGSSMVMRGKAVKLTAEALPISVGNIGFKWESLTPEFAEVNKDTGEVTGKKYGIAIITATAQDGSAAQASHTMQVTDPTEKFDITDAENKIITGKLIGIDPDAAEPVYKAEVKILPETACQDVEWKSSNEKVAEIKNIDGNHAIITAKAIGKAEITAKAVDGSAKMAKISVNVNTLSKSVKITGNHYLAKGRTLQLKAEVGERDAADKSVIWESSAPKVADVNEKGIVTAVGTDGDAVITAKAADGSGAYAEHAVYVRNGKCTVTLTDRRESRYSIQDKNDNLTMDVDLSEHESVSIDLQASLTGHSQSGSVPFDIIWSTSSKSIADVEADKDNPGIGHVTIHKAGTVRITAKSADGCEAGKTVAITVKNENPYVKITGPAHRLANGKRMKLSAGDVPVTWSSDNTGIATVSSSGQVTACRNVSGKVKIIAKAQEGTLSGTYDIEVGETAKSVELSLNGETLLSNDKIGVDITKGYKGNNNLKLAAKLNFSDNTSEADSKNVTWKSSNAGIAAIDEAGNVELRKNGNVTFTATASDGSNKKAKVTFMVQKQLTAITPAGKADVYVGLNKSAQLKLNCKPLAAAGRKVVWESDNSGIVSVGKDNGKITGKRSGASAVITAKAADDNTVSCKFTVYVEAPISRVAIVKDADAAGTAYSVYGIDLSADKVMPLKLKANLYRKEYGVETLCLGPDVIWSSSNKDVASVDENGNVTGLKNGEATITAMAADGSKKFGRVKVYCGKLIKMVTDKTSANILANGIKLNLNSKKAKTYDIADKLAVLPAMASNPELAYASDDKKIAAVDAKGRVTAKKAGTTYITVTPKDGSGAINDTIKRIQVTVE